MSETLPPVLPETLHRLLDGSDLDGKVGETMELLTVGPEGWPHVALLSAGEVLAATPEEIRLALWPSSQTTANLRRTGQARQPTTDDVTYPFGNADLFRRQPAVPASIRSLERPRLGGADAAASFWTALSSGTRHTCGGSCASTRPTIISTGLTGR